MRHVIITLEQVHLDFADELGRTRQARVERHKMRGSNGAPDWGPKALERHIFGARGECAAFLWLRPIKWRDRAGLPDFDDFIDVKTVHRTGWRVIVGRDSPDEWAYLLISAEHHPRYIIEGWIWGREAKQDRFWDDPVGGRAAFFVPNRELRDPAELKAELERRRHSGESGCSTVAL